MRAILDAEDESKWRDIVSWIASFNAKRLVRLHVLSPGEVELVMRECEMLDASHQGRAGGKKGATTRVSLEMLLELDSVWGKLHDHGEMMRRVKRWRQKASNTLSPWEEQSVREELQGGASPELNPLLEAILERVKNFSEQKHHHHQQEEEKDKGRLNALFHHAASK